MGDRIFPDLKPLAHDPIHIKLTAKNLKSKAYDMSNLSWVLVALTLNLNELCLHVKLVNITSSVHKKL